MFLLENQLGGSLNWSTPWHELFMKQTEMMPIKGVISVFDRRLKKKKEGKNNQTFITKNKLNYLVDRKWEMSDLVSPLKITSFSLQESKTLYL